MLANTHSSNHKPYQEAGFDPKRHFRTWFVSLWTGPERVRPKSEWCPVWTEETCIRWRKKTLSGLDLEELKALAVICPETPRQSTDLSLNLCQVPAERVGSRRSWVEFRESVKQFLFAPFQFIHRPSSRRTMTARRELCLESEACAHRKSLINIDTRPLWLCALFIGHFVCWEIEIRFWFWNASKNHEISIFLFLG